jgi:hypothetical protein
VTSLKPGSGTGAEATNPSKNAARAGRLFNTQLHFPGAKKAALRQPVIY